MNGKKVKKDVYFFASLAVHALPAIMIALIMILGMGFSGSGLLSGTAYVALCALPYAAVACGVIGLIFDFLAIAKKKKWWVIVLLFAVSVLNLFIGGWLLSVAAA